MLRFILIFLLSLPVFAEHWIGYNTGTNEIIQVVEGDGKALNICDENNSNIASGYFIATVSEYEKARTSYVKIDPLGVIGSRVIDYTAQEISDYDAAVSAANDASVRSGAKAYMDNFSEVDLILRALAESIRGELNILRTLHSLPDRTKAQLKTAIKNKVDSGDAD